MFIAGRTKTYYPNPSISYIVHTKRGTEIFWNTVADSRNNFQYGDSNYDGFAGDTTFMNYAGKYAQGGYSFQTTRGTGLTPSENPTVLFEMLKGKNLTVNGGLEIKNEISISNNGQSVKLSYTNPTSVAYNPNITSTLQIYYSAFNATCYNVACPLVIKDLSIDLNNNAQLAFPIPEFIYVNVLSNHVYIILPYVNQSVGNVDVLTQTCRFRVRQMTGGYNLYFKTYSEPLYPGRTGGIMYDFQNAYSDSPYYTGAWYLEVHYYLGNWYCTRLE